MTVPAEQRNATIAKAVEALVAGKSIREIAVEQNIPPMTLHGWLMSDVGPAYRELQEKGLIARILAADEELESARDHVAISRARERCKFTRWDAERRAKRLFAVSTELSGPGQGPIVLEDREVLRRFAFINAMARQNAAIEGDFVKEETNDRTD